MRLSLRFARGDFLFERFPETRFHAFRNGLRFDTFIDLKRLLSSVYHDEAIWTFADVLFQMAFGRRIATGVQIIIQFLKELFTG